MFWSFLSALLLGGLLGFVFQRARFCLTGGFRDMYLSKNNRMFYALLIAISVQSIGVLALIELGYISSPYKAFLITFCCWLNNFWDKYCSCKRLRYRNLVSSR